MTSQGFETTSECVVSLLSEVAIWIRRDPLGPLGFNFAQHSPTTRPSVARTADETFLLLDRVKLSSAGARVEETQGGSRESSLLTTSWSEST